MLAQQSGFRKLEAYSLSDIGNYYVLTARFEQARQYLHQSLEVRINAQDTIDIISGYNNLGLAFQQEQLYDSAVFYLDSGLHLARNAGNTRLQGVLLSGLSMSVLQQARYQLAERYLLEAVELAEAENDTNALANRYQNLGNLYERIDRFAFAEEYYSHAEELFRSQNNVDGWADVLLNKGALLLRQERIDTALILMRKAQEIAEHYSLHQKRATIYNNLGYAHLLAGQTSEAKRAFEQGLEWARTRANGHALASIGLNFLRLKLAEQRYGEMLEFLPELKLALDENKLLHYLPDYYSLQAAAFAGQGAYRKAHQAQLRSSQYRDSLALLIDRSQASLAVAEHAKNAKKLAEGELELEASKAKAQEERAEKLFILVVALVLILAGLLIIGALRNRNRKLKAARQAEAERVEELLSEMDFRVLESQVAADRDASKRIGQNLHDNLGGTLASIQTRMDRLLQKEEMAANPLKPQLSEVVRLLEASFNELRTISHDLADKGSDARGLTSMLAEYVRNLDEIEQLEAHFVPITPPFKLDAPVEREIFAMVRALLGNVLRHAQAGQVIVQLRGGQESLHVTVEDDGVGFRKLPLNKYAGHGLRNIEERAKALGGSFSIESTPGKGTTAMIDIPILSP